MIRRATINDIDGVEQVYLEVLDYESQHTVYTSWKKGVYPTPQVAQRAVENGTLFVCEENNEIAGAVVLNQIQPEEYENINWSITATPKQVLVIHTLCIRPCFSARGKGLELMAFAMQYAQQMVVKVIRLDTYEGNVPAVSLYKKLGYHYAGSTEFNFEKVIWETLKCFEKSVI
jgi:ribosomal protein S18 acetylase RimI-like enzyme